MMTQVDTSPAPPGTLSCQKDSSLRLLRTIVYASRECVEPATKIENARRYFELELYDTVLFPEGGGQPCDTGKIDDMFVEKVYVKDGRCLHRVPVKDSAQAPFMEGQEVVVTVNWSRRLDHMQQHSAQHLLSAIAEKYGYQTTSWSLGEERCNVELISANATSVLHSPSEKKGGKENKIISFGHLQTIEDEVNEAILAGLAMYPSFAEPGTEEWNKIASKFAPEDMPKIMRIVTIDGLDANPCCGTHVKNLAQLRSLRIVNTEFARGTFRIWFVAGDRVNRDFSRMLKKEQTMTKLLSTGPENHTARVNKLLQFQKWATKEIKHLEKELAVSIARDLVARPGNIVVNYHRCNGDLGFLQTLLGVLGGAISNTIFVLTAGELHGEGFFLIAGPLEFIAVHGKAVLPIIDGRGGGGKNGVIQGKAKSLANVDALIIKLQELRLQP